MLSKQGEVGSEEHLKGTDRLGPRELEPSRV